MPFLRFTDTDGNRLNLRLTEARLPSQIREALAAGYPTRFLPHGMQLEAHDLPIPPEQAPCFFSWQRWELLFESAIPRNHIQFFLNGLPILTSSRPSSNLFGSFVLQDAIGYSELELVVDNGQRLFSLELEVFPQKLRYKTDFQEMLGDLQRYLCGLAFDEMKRTASLLETDETQMPTLSSWIGQLRGLMKGLEQSLLRIVQQPNRTRTSERHILPIRKVQELPRDVASWLAKHPQYVEQESGAGWLTGQGFRVNHLPVKDKTLSYDTAENRFVLWAIKQILDRLDHWESLFVRHASNRVQPLWAIELGRFRRRLIQMQAQPFFRHTGHFWPAHQLSTVLMMGPGYREFYKRFLLLKKGLSLSDAGIFQLDLKNTSTLYEYWCLLTLVQMLKELPGYELIGQDVVTQQADQLVIRLQKGERSQLIFRHSLSQTHLRLWYNRTFGEGDSFTFRQIPDIVLEVEKPGYTQAFRYVIEVKYQFDRGNGAYPRTAVPHGPPLEAISQLHRYRDAIISQEEAHLTHRSAWKLMGGIVLFPFPDTEDEFVPHPFYQSLAKVEIGAIPLHPGPYHAHTLLRNWLHRLIEYSPEALYEQVVDYNRTEQQARIDEIETPMLILPLPHAMELDTAEREKVKMMREQLRWFFPESEELGHYRDVGFFAPHLNKIVAFARDIRSRTVSDSRLSAEGIPASLLEEETDYRLLEWTNLEGCAIPFPDFPAIAFFPTNRFSFELARLNRSASPLRLNSYLWIRAWQEIHKHCKNISWLSSIPAEELRLTFVWKRVRFVCEQRDNQEQLVLSHRTGHHCFWRPSEPLVEILSAFYRKTRRKKT
ncbi:MAG: DUF2357 domain-containing protein [Bacteroidota bacterium]